MNNRRGFTLIEILVVITVIAIVSSIALMTYTKTQQQSRDSQRSVSATIVVEGLEKYYSENGEYPSIAKMIATNATTPKNLLGLSSLESFVPPRSADGTTTNIWKTGAASSTNPLTYSANTDTSASCLTGNTATDVCTDFKVQYYVEKTNSVETIVSRNVAVAPPVIPPPTTPSAPTVTVALSGSNALATSSTVTCVGSASPEYASRNRTNDSATWTAYTAWSTTQTASTAAAQGSKYGFQFKARCIDGSLISSEATSTEGTYIRPISAPAVTALSHSVSGSTSTWSWPAVACPAGTNDIYAINRGTDYDTSGAIGWLGWTADQATLAWTRDTSSQGYEYTAVMRAKCTTTYATSGWSAESNYSQYIRPVATPGSATNWGYSIAAGRAYFRWTWTEPACGPGTSRSWMWDGYVGDVNNANGWNMYWLDKGPYYHYWYGASAPSYQDPGWYTGAVLDLDLLNGSTPYGIDVYARLKHRCMNPATQRQAQGAWNQSPQNFT